MSDYPLEIDVQSVRQLQESNEDFLFLDCRSAAEREVAMIEGSVLIEMGEIPMRLDDIAEYADKRVVVHCHIGGRSLRVANWLRVTGFPHAQNMTGGIEAWSDEVDPSVPKY